MIDMDDTREFTMDELKAIHANPELVKAVTSIVAAQMFETVVIVGEVRAEIRRRMREGSKS